MRRREVIMRQHKETPIVELDEFDSPFSLDPTWVIRKVAGIIAIILM